MARRAWTGSDQKWLAENYQKLGPKACADHLGRSLRVVYHRARQLGVARALDEIRIPTSDHIDSVIRECHASGSDMPWIDAGKRVNRPARWIGARARALGLFSRARPRKPMSRGEAAFVVAHLHWPAERIAASMSNRGTGSVEHFIRKNGLGGSDTDYMSGAQVGEAMGVHKRTVYRWIERGLLIAERRGLPGADDTFAIAEADLAAFILLNPEMIHLGKIETAQTKSWFFDLISRHPKPPTRNDLYAQRQIASLHAARPDYDVERIATVLGVERKTVVNTLAPDNKKRRAA